ncbi:MAG TPA: ABC transporter ATP-binding protein [Stellaceae bacterium]|jgi:branched-chain amino acid transport system ATP-binding protein
MSDALLDVTELSAGYGDSLVLERVSLSVPKGHSLAVLGRNGMGKSTLMLALMGHLKLRHGTVRWRGEDISRASPDRRVQMGLGWVPQGREVFPSLTVDEHLVIAARPGPWNREAVYAQFPKLAERRRNLGRELSGGEQQMLAIGRTLMTNPELLLLDEPLEGLAPVIVQDIAHRIRRLMAEQGLTIILVEQHTRFALGLTEQVLVLERGRAVHSGPSVALRDDVQALDRLVGMRSLRDRAAAH